MTELFNLIKWILLDLFRSRGSLEAEVIALRQQLNVLRRNAPKRPALSMFDRLILVWLYRFAPSVLGSVAIVRPETIVRWHRAGFRICGGGSLEDEPAGRRCLSMFAD